MQPVALEPDRYDSVKKLLRRGGWQLVSQGSNMLGNLLAVLLVASNSSAERFGSWSVGYAVALMVLAVGRSIGGTHLVLQSHRLRASAERGAVSAALWCGVVAGAAMSAVGMLSGGAVAQSLAIFGVVVPMLLLQDALRFVFIARRENSVTAAMDVSWLLIQIAVFAALEWNGEPDYAIVTLVWGVSALASCGLARRRVALLLGPSAGLAFLSSRRHETSRLLPDALLNALSVHAATLVLVAVVGPASAAALRAGQTLFGPLNTVVAGLSPMMEVEAVRAVRRGVSPFRLALLWSGFLFLVGAMVVLGVWWMPDRVGIALLGDSWRLVPLVLTPLSVQALLRGPLTSGPIILRARHQLNQALVLRMVTSAVALVLPVAGALVWDASGAAWGIATAVAIGGAVALAWIRVTQGVGPNEIGGSNKPSPTHDRSDGPIVRGSNLTPHRRRRLPGSTRTAETTPKSRSQQGPP